MRTIVPIATILLIALSGCLEENNDQSEQKEMLSTEKTPIQNTPIQNDNGNITKDKREFSGTSTVTEVSVCSHEDGCPIVGGRFGHWSQDIADTFGPIYNDTTGYVNVTWDAAIPGLEALRIYIFQGSAAGYTVVATTEGTSPVSMPIAGEEFPTGGRYKVGFTGDGPATVLIDQQVHWEAVLFSTP